MSKCKAWLQEEHPDLFDKYYSDGASLSLIPSWICVLTNIHGVGFPADALQQKAGALSLEAQAKLDKKAASMEAKADVKAEADLKKKKVRACLSCTADLVSDWPVNRLPRYVQYLPGLSQPLRGLGRSTRSRLPQVTIKRIERNKRKHVTSIHGLEAFGQPAFTSCSSPMPQTTALRWRA
jgi:hypothetical protein